MIALITVLLWGLLPPMSRDRQYTMAFFLLLWVAGIHAG